MSWFERFSVALLICVVAILLAGKARSDPETDRRVATLRALVRGEPVSWARFDDGRSLEPRLEEGSFFQPDFQCGEPTPPHRLRWELVRAVRHASLRFAIARDLIHSVIRHESAYDPDALSPAGAMGLMQLMPATARELGVVCPYDPRENIVAGTRYLRELHDRFGSWPLALAAYNAGPTAVVERRVPPITRLYVRRVLSSWRHGARDGV